MDLLYGLFVGIAVLVAFFAQEEKKKIFAGFQMSPLRCANGGCNDGRTFKEGALQRKNILR